MLAPLKLNHRLAYTRFGGSPSYVFDVNGFLGGSDYLAASASDNCVKIFNKNLGFYEKEAGKNGSAGVVETLRGHEASISGLLFSHSNPSLLFTSSMDGKVFLW
eukprot:Sdes_comp8986_c0_seq1m401